MRKILAFLACLSVSCQMGYAEGFTERFEELGADWHVADYAFGHPHFDTDWDADLVQADAGLGLKLIPQAGKENRFRGASVRRLEKTGYGRYEAVIQPAKGAGIVTGFFTYTGAHYGDRHDEIDIEFLGKNTNQIHLATFVDGKLWNKFIDLGFDASDRPRAYAFEWDQGVIRWYVEDRLIYERRAEVMPEKPGMLFANLWAADPKIKSWSGEAIEGTEAQAFFGAVKYTPFATSVNGVTGF